MTGSSAARLFSSLPLLLFVFNGLNLLENTVNGDVLVLTVASDDTDGYDRYLRSARIFGIPVTTLGRDQEWRGGSMKSTGGGQKINLLRQEVEKYKNDRDKIIIFTDSYDVIFLQGLDRILAEFENIGGRIVFGAEPFCWPDGTLENLYPKVDSGKRFLNSGGIIGYAPELYKVLSYKSIADDEDDQLFYTLVYLNEGLRKKLDMRLDHNSRIFHNLNGARGELSLSFKDDEPYLENTVTKTQPLILHGNGPSKVGLNNLANYLARSWSPTRGCLSCMENMIELDDENTENYPEVMLAVFIAKATPFFEDFLHKVGELDYPKSKMILFVYNNVKYHGEDLRKFLDNFRKKYKSVKEIKPEDEIADSQAKTLAVEHFKNTKCEYYFNLDSDAHLDNPYTLKILIEQNRSIVAPMLVRPYKAWSNFWGSIDDSGYYSRSFDYMDLVNNKKRGLWNVPYITSCYLINGTIIRNEETTPNYIEDTLDLDMAFCYGMREKGKFMYVSNRLDFGHLIDSDSFDIRRTHPDFYQLLNNRWDWEQRYLHENYTDNLDPNKTALMPCPDVYWFPVASPRFCRELIEICETYGKWSDGTNQDARLEGGYENVPTRDIHMKQIGLEFQWLNFLKEYVRPLQEKVFIGYYHNDNRIEGGYEAVPTRDIHMTQIGFHIQWLKFLERYVSPLNQKVFTGYEDEPPKAIMNFVVRYKPDEQPSLRPHHDSSTYTINLALNTPKVDFEGGGCRFIRYNCNVTNTKMGWLLMHPGRLTHYHEGLLVTKGTRYIMVSFIDP